MPQFELWFSNPTSPELARTKLSYPLSESPLLSVRGKSSSLFGSQTGTFQWTPAVMGLSILMLYTAAEYLEKSDAEIALEGTRDSLIASFDFAIGKPPVWIQEMFSSSKSGEAFVKRAFRRNNPEFKAGDAVILSLNTSLIPAAAVQIYMDGVACQDPADLKIFASRIIQESSKTGAITILKSVAATHAPSTDKKTLEDIPFPFGFSNIKEDLHAWFSEEALTVLRNTDIFTEHKTAGVLNHIVQDSLFSQLAGNGVTLLNNIKTPKALDKRFGLLAGYPELEKELLEGPPLTVALPMGFAGSTAILYFLRDIKGYNICINANFCYAIEIMRRIITGQFSEPPDLCVIGSAPAATLLQHGLRVGYQPLMLAPGMTHRIIGSTSAGKVPELNNGEIHFIKEDPSTSGFYLDTLHKQNLVSKNRVRLTHAEPHEIFELLQSADPDARGLLFFPFYHLNIRFNGSVLLDHPADAINIKESFMFYHERLRERSKQLEAFELAFRDAWLTLRSGGPALSQTVQCIISDTEYLKALQRFSGLYTLMNPSLSVTT